MRTPGTTSCGPIATASPWPSQRTHSASVDLLVSLHGPGPSNPGWTLMRQGEHTRFRE